MPGLVLVAGMIGLAACGGETSGTSPTTVPATIPLTSTAWVLSTYRGANGGAVGAVSGVHATLAFEAHGTLAGSTGCNSFAGTWRSDGSSAVTPGAMTQMACTSAELNAQETTLLQLLPQVRTYSVSDATLVLKSAAAKVLLTYVAGLPGLGGTSWSATGVNNGRGAVVSTSATEALTADFSSDGTFSTFGGCGQLGGSYQVSGPDGLTITVGASTLQACEGEAGTLETEYLAALGRVATYQIHGDQLTLRDSSGATQVTYRLAS